MKKVFYINIPALLVLLSCLISQSIAQSTTQDSLCKFWVVFIDKPSDNQISQLSPRALIRRAKANAAPSSWADLDVNRSYINSIVSSGAQLRNVYKWENSASFYAPLSSLKQIRALPFVKAVEPVAVYTKKKNKDILAKGAASTSIYGGSYDQLSQVSVPGAHQYLQKVTTVAPGHGILVGFFDSGFSLRHPCFSYARTNHTVIATYDFIDNDTSVEDPDSVRNNSKHPYFGNDVHGSQTLSLVAGYDPGYFLGIAWDARFVLARTENTKAISTPPYEVEEHTEEDNWATAMVWAESIGVDIVSSSLGYRTGFTDSIDDYTFQDMDGKTTICSRAASRAVALGMIVVNAMGNDGYDTSDVTVKGTLNAPADVEGVISVGAIDGTGRLGYFSSTGPTASGIIKPDLVAQGVGDLIPDVYHPEMHRYYYGGTGTSFSTPIVAGICALVKQAHQGSSDLEVKNYLFSSCKRLPWQDTIDVFYGRGIPNTLRACLASNVAWIRVIDKEGRVIPDAQITDQGGSLLTRSDSNGIAFFKIDTSKVPFRGSIKFAGLYNQPFSLKYLPFDTTIKIYTDFENSSFSLFPSVLSKTDSLTMVINPRIDEGRKLTLIIRSLDGNLVWSYSRFVNMKNPVQIRWNCRAANGKRVIPGLYAVIASYNQRTYGKKIILE